ncbi:AraC family transcriptional regulator [Gracilibacillus alcaliphilus]|uniref:AraC family transcriptional regulator n=1 Tax=Gracilibacillus alcaliphilus TaxID=1401441 RepID=UPI0019585A63|nr:AraC family transcriptional regulator [Gracilibacillus alcaliphilus]MBM7677801.1 AraC-like DNA-binding protein [Gracilibacillus alcaliphilus]
MSSPKEISSFKIEDKTTRKTAKDFHSHAGYEIVWVKYGEAVFIFEEQIYRVKGDQVLLFKSTDFHKVSFAQDQIYKRVVLLFTEDFLQSNQIILQRFKHMLDDLPVPRCVLHLFMWRKDGFQQIIEKLLREYQDIHAWEQQSALELYLAELLLYLTREIHTSFLPQHAADKQPTFEQTTLQERMLTEIDAIWHTNWQLEALAEKLHFNKYYLCRIFKKEFGMTIQQYILHRRITEAKQALRKTTISINALSEQIGFSTASNFIRCFKQHVDMTPKQYREQYVAAQQEGREKTVKSSNHFK